MGPPSPCPGHSPRAAPAGGRASCRSAAGSLPEGDINQDRERDRRWGGVGWGGEAGGTQRITHTQGTLMAPPVCSEGGAWAARKASPSTSAWDESQKALLIRMGAGGPKKHSVCLVTQSYPTLLRPHGLYPPDSSVHGILQARILAWIAISFSRGSSQPRDQKPFSCTGRWLLYQGSPERDRDQHQDTEKVQ